jgi:hypothetical protein
MSLAQCVAAVLKVFDVVHNVEPPLLVMSDNIPDYLIILA